MYNNSKIAKSVRYALLLGASATAMSGAAVAQQETQTQGQGADDRVERIQVTGSRIRRTDMETSSPIQVISSEDIAAAGYTRIEDLLNELPAIVTGQSSFIANGATGTASLNLRGLGASRTLVLVNGRRLQPGGFNTEIADVNQIPTSLVERVEVLTGGGSSTYGSDAVAGVVNFVMKTDFEGMEVNVGASGYQHGNSTSVMQDLQDQAGFDYPGSTGIDGETFTIDIAGGTTFDNGRGHATVYASWRQNDEVRQGDRDYSSCALNAAGTACGGSATATNPNFFLTPVIDGTADAGQLLQRNLDPNGGFRDIDVARDYYNFAPINHFMRPNERYSIGSFFEYEVSERFRPYLETNYMHSRSVAQIAESGIFGVAFRFDPTDDLVFTPEQQAFFAENFAGADQVQAQILKRNSEGGPRQTKLENNSYRVVVGAEGMLTDTWDYDVSFQYGASQSTGTSINDFYLPELGSRLNAVGFDRCLPEDGCLPYQVFQPGGVTPEAAADLGGVGIQAGYTYQRVLSGYVTGELPFALPTSSYPIAAVFGVENRELYFERDSDTLFQNADLAGLGGPTESIAGRYNVREVFGELQIPLLEDMVGVRDLLLDVGYRYSDYSTSGGVSAYKVGLDWTITDDYKARASYNRAVRAPTVTNLFGAQNVGLWSGSDDCAGSTPEATFEQCARSGVTEAQYGSIPENPANQQNGFFGGNPDLQPEEADTFTVGLVGNPFENFNFAIDFWDVQIEGGIGSIPASVILTQCLQTGEAEFCDAINRGEFGDLWLEDTNFISSTSVNVSEQNYRGIDVSANYLFDAFGGTFRNSFMGTYNLKQETVVIPGVGGTSYDCAGITSSQCVASPEWNHIMSTNYSQGGDWSVGARWRYVGGFDYNHVGGTRDVLIGDGVGSVSYFDLNGRYQFNDVTSMTFGVNNIFDRHPPVVGDVNSDQGNVLYVHDMLGRYLFANVNFRF